MSDALLLTWFCLVIADVGALRTIYHSRIDGLLFPAIDEETMK